MNPILKPMLASLTEAPLTDPDLIYEPKYDGIRAIAEINGDRVHLWSRLGNEKTTQFPEIAEALRHRFGNRAEPLIIDGEIVALDGHGEPTGFQHLQGRIHLLEPKSRRSAASVRADPSVPRPSSAAFIAFDLLRDGRTDLRERPLTERRKALEGLFKGSRSALLRVSESVRGDGRALYQRALDSGWEGLIAKHADSKYRSDKRTPDWRKLKIVHEQEFVIGGWTEPRQTRAYFGALLLGVYEAGQAPGARHEAPGTASAPETRKPATGTGTRRPAPGTRHHVPLVYVGHTGTGFNENELARLMKLLKPLEIETCPFAARPKTNERAHWVTPSLVAQIKFTEWTADQKLRHPVYLGLRDDKKPEEVVREGTTRLHGESERLTGRPEAQNVKTPERVTKKPGRGEKRKLMTGQEASALLDQLTALESARRDGTLDLPDGDRLSVTNLHKAFWPALKLTKGDLFRYYVEAAPFILPAIQDRPLTMKRYPDGANGKPFYQHRAPDQIPSNVRVEHVRGEKTVPSRFIGGDLKTLLYMTQLASISQDPWFSRTASPEYADHVALDLDPADGVPFAQVLDVARWIHDELEHLGTLGVPKTSGADGLHVYFPLPKETPYDAGLIFCQIIATVVAQKHPKHATIERSVKARGKRVYVDYLQNIQGKTLATAYSARSSAYAGVSTPLTWAEIDEGVEREDFTIRTLPERLRQVGDLWAPLRTSKGIDLSVVSKYTSSERADGGKSGSGRKRK